MLPITLQCREQTPPHSHPAETVNSAKAGKAGLDRKRAGGEDASQPTRPQPQACAPKALPCKKHVVLGEVLLFPGLAANPDLVSPAPPSSCLLLGFCSHNRNPGDDGRTNMAPALPDVSTALRARVQDWHCCLVADTGDGHALAFCFHSCRCNPLLSPGQPVISSPSVHAPILGRAPEQSLEKLRGAPAPGLGI